MSKWQFYPDLSTCGLSTISGYSGVDTGSLALFESGPASLVADNSGTGYNYVFDNPETDLLPEGEYDFTLSIEVSKHDGSTLTKDE